MNTYILFAFISQLLILDSVQVVNSDLLKELDTILVFNKEVLEPKNANLSFYAPIILRLYYKNGDTLNFYINRDFDYNMYFFCVKFFKGKENCDYPTEYFVYKDRLFAIEYGHYRWSNRAFRDEIRKNFFKPATGQTYLIPTTPINFWYGLPINDIFLKFYKGTLINKKNY